MMYYGLDVHKKFIQVCALSKDGKTEDSFKIGGTREEITKFAAGLRKDNQVVLETTFNSWAVYDILRSSKARVVVSDANQVKMIAKARVKTDKIDASVLARLLRAEFIPEVPMPSAETWMHRQLVSHRRFLGKQRTAAKNAIWGVLNRKLIVPPSPDLFTNASLKWLASIVLEKADRLMLDNLLLLLENLELAIDKTDEEIRSIAANKNDLRILMTIPGVSTTVALGMLSAIGDINRFDTPDKLASYFGLVPSISQSAEKCYYGRITKEGTSYGRWLAIEAAQCLALSGSPITASYHRIKRKKNHNVAVTALARKLITVVWHMLKKQEPYRYATPESLRRKMRILDPSLAPRSRAYSQSMSLNAIFDEAGLRIPAPPTESEKSAATNNRRTITRIKAAEYQAKKNKARKIKAKIDS